MNVITTNDVEIIENSTEEQDFNKELYRDFLDIVGKRKEINEKLKKELKDEFPSDILESFIKRFDRDNNKSNRVKGFIIDSCIRPKKDFKFPHINKFDLYKSEKSTQLLGYTTKNECVCLVLNDTIIKNSNFNDFISLFLSDVKTENTAANIYYKIKELYDRV